MQFPCQLYILLYRYVLNFSGSVDNLTGVVVLRKDVIVKAVRWQPMAVLKIPTE